MSENKNNAETVDCSPAELRELQRYVQSLEKELHEKKRQLVHVRAARSIRIARAVSQLKKKPAEAASEIWNILRSPRDTSSPAPAAVQHRSFDMFRRNASVPSLRGTYHTTVLAEVVDKCAKPDIVTLVGSAPTPLSMTSADRYLAIGPQNYELVLSGSHRPQLLIDIERLAPTSPWAGVFGVDDMRLNLAMANVFEMVAARGGQVAMVPADPSLAPPLLCDFQARAVLVENFTSVDLDSIKSV